MAPEKIKFSMILTTVAQPFLFQGISIIKDSFQYP